MEFLKMNFLKGNIWTGVAIGVGLLAAPVVISIVAAAVRPAAKFLIAGALNVYDAGHAFGGAACDYVSTLIDEAKSEVTGADSAGRRCLGAEGDAEAPSLCSQV
jgi:hypothetical protein